MEVRAIETEKIRAESIRLTELLNKYIFEFQEKSILAITSKIVALCEGSIVPIGEADKDELISKEAQYFLPRNSNPYHVSLTITRNNLVASAGIDESNADGNYVLWPRDPQKTANEIRDYLTKRFNLKKAGVVISDSKTTPFRWGVTAFALAHSGFKALKDYIGTEDLFGRKFLFEKLNISDSLATSAALVMGEGSEQTPLAVISDVPFIEFQDRNPTKEEIDSLRIELESDLYTPILSSAPWKKGEK